MEASPIPNDVPNTEISTKLIGHRLSVEVVGETEPIIADVFAIDTQANCIIFRQQKAHTWQKADYFMIPKPSIKHIEVRLINIYPISTII